MRLHEEYIKRHNLDIPIVRHDKVSTVFLKSKESPVCWRIINVRWNSCYWHPGKFHITFQKPIHDFGNKLKNVSATKKCYWDEYESHLLKWSKKLRKDFSAIPEEDCDLSLWYMFLMMYDSKLAKTCLDIKSLILESIKPEHEKSTRKMFFSKAKSQLREREPDLFEAFRYSVQPLSENYADWLADLINE